MEIKEKFQEHLWDLNAYDGKVYEPKEDTLFFLETLESDLPMIKSLNPATILEIGSGSGLVISSLSEVFRKSFCLAIDINPSACLATVNTSKLNKTSVNAVQGDLINGMVLKNLIDVLIINLIYLPSKSQILDDSTAKAWSGGMDGKAIIERLLPQLNDLMSEKSVGYLLAISNTSPRQIEKMLEGMGFTAGNIQIKTLTSLNYALIRFTKGI
ncbi:unnamed protein product [Nezara viridula]|uniref:Uncharacterized protein n=1 Tax=Nezara viridula TaxID=85310 RepID=A0A9P0E8Y6_NEZVI|nr:unnamed protein product [Nezara viridula]